MAHKIKKTDAKPAAIEFDAGGYLEARTYADGQRLFSIGEAADKLFMVKAGRVRVTASKGSQILVDILGPGEVFGKMPRLAGATFDETGSADGEAEVWILHAKDVERLTTERPAVAATLLEGMAMRSERLDRRVRSFAFRDVPARIAETLLDLAERQGEASSNGELDIRGVTQSDIGDLVGCSRPFASTVFNEFKRAGATELRGRTIVILNQRHLRRAAVEEKIRT